MCLWVLYYSPSKQRFFLKQHLQVALCNGNEMCLHCSRDWVIKYYLDEFPLQRFKKMFKFDLLAWQSLFSAASTFGRSYMQELLANLFHVWGQSANNKGHGINENKMGAKCRTHKENEQWIENFRRETRKKEFRMRSIHGEKEK